MSLKSVAEKLAKDLEGAGKKLDRAVVKLAETVDGIVGTVPKAQLTEKGFEGLPLAARKAMLDGVLKVTDAAPNDAAKSKIVIEYLNSLRTKFPEGKTGDDAFKKFGTQFAEGLDQEIKAAANPTLIRQPGVVATAAPRQTAGGPVATPRQATPVSTGAENPTINIDARTRPPGERNMGRIEPKFQEPTPPPAGGGKAPPRNDFPGGGDDFDPSGNLKKIGRELDRLRESSFLYRLHGGVAGSVGSQADKEILKTEGVLGKADRIADARDGAKSAKARDLLEFLHQHIESPEYQHLPLQKPLIGKTLSPIETLEALKSGKRVPPESIERLDKYFQVNHLSAESASNAGANASAIMGKVGNTIMAPVRAANVFGDARANFSLRLGTGAALLGTTMLASSWIYGMENADLGRNAGNLIPPTTFTELIEFSAASQQGVDALSAGGEWAIAQANGPFWGAGNPKFKQELMDAAKAFRDNGKDTSRMSPEEKEAHLNALKTQNPKFAKITLDQVEAGLYLIEQTGKVTTTETVVAEAGAQNDAARRAANAQAALTSPGDVPMLDVGITPTQPAPQAAFAQYRVDGETFDNRLKGFGNPELYTALANVFKRVTEMPVKPDEELTAANKLSHKEAILFAEEAKTILSAQKIEPERVDKIVELLLRPSAAEPAPAR